MSRPPDPARGPDPAVLGEAERARLPPLASALRTAAAGCDRAPTLTPVAGDLAGARRVGLLAGTFNPFTTAHAAIAEAARGAGIDRVLLTMAPVSLGKETVERAHALDRLDWLVAWARARPWVAVTVASHPLLVDMVEACARLLDEVARDGGVAGGRPAITLLLGSDKAEQIADPRWYADPAAAHERLTRLASVVVAVRAGHAVELATLPFPATRLATPGWTADRSATQARARAAEDGGFGDLVPPEVAGLALRSRAYDPDPDAYTARSRALQALVEQPLVEGA